MTFIYLILKDISYIRDQREREPEISHRTDGEMHDDEIKHILNINPNLACKQTKIDTHTHRQLIAKI